MPTIGQIMQVAFPTVIRELNRDYIIGDVREPIDRSIRTVRIFDRESGHHVSIAWSIREEFESEAKRIALVKELLSNAIDRLDRVVPVINRREYDAEWTPDLFNLRPNAAMPDDDPVVDVDFS